MTEKHLEKSTLQRLLPGALILLILLLAFVFSPFTTDQLLNAGAEFSRYPMANVAVVLLMILMMTFGLPGSMCFWLIAPFQPPLVATSLLVLGSSSGAVGAYYVGTRLSTVTPTTGIGRRVHQLLTERGDWLTQCALRMLPGFPHVLVNFTSGILRLPLLTFILAALIGLSIKWGVYSSAVYGATNVLQAERALDVTTLTPLAILGLLVLIGAQFRKTRS